jgi:hypothetical protein
LERLLAERRRVLDAIAEATCLMLRPTLSARELHDCALRLRQVMAAYTDLEDALLPEVLASVDAWGRERVAQLEREHARRRNILDGALEAIGARPDEPGALRDLLAGMTVALQQQLALEEEQVLREDLLRDDFIEIDFITA